MAAGEKELDLDTSDSSKKGGSKMIIFILLGVLLIGGGIAAALLLTSSDEQKSEVAEEEVTEDRKPAEYLPMKPPFVANYNVDGRQRYLQIELTLVTRESSQFDAIEEHMPMIRNNVVTILSEQTFDDLRSMEGKDTLRETILESIQNKMEEETGETALEEVLFTSFVMQ